MKIKFIVGFILMNEPKNFTIDDLAVFMSVRPRSHGRSRQQQSGREGNLLDDAYDEVRIISDLIYRLFAKMTIGAEARIGLIKKAVRFFQFDSIAAVKASTLISLTSAATLLIRHKLILAAGIALKAILKRPLMRFIISFFFSTDSIREPLPHEIDKNNRLTKKIRSRFFRDFARRIPTLRATAVQSV